MALFHGGLFALIILCSLLTTDVVAGRVKPAALELSVTKHEQSADIETEIRAGDWDSCKEIAADVKAIAAAGVELNIEHWEGVYKCLQKEGENANTIMFIECGIDPAKDNTPRCWERSRADDLQQFENVARQKLDEIGAGIAGFFSGGDGKDGATGVASLISAGQLSQLDASLMPAIQAFCQATGDPEAEATLTSQLDTLNPFEKAFTVAMLDRCVAFLNSATPASSSALQVSHSEAGELHQQGKEVAVAESSPGESWFTTLCRLIDRISQQRNQARAGRVQNRAMAQGIGWDHVWGELRKAGFKAGRR